MKKTRIAGLVFGVLALAAGAAGTYAWFTATDSNAAIDVTAATIAVTSETLTTNTMEGGYLPGETIKAEGVEVKNTGSREAVIKIVPSVEAATAKEKDTALKDALENLKVNYNTTDYTNVYVGKDNAGNDVLYVFLAPEAVFGETVKPVSISADIKGSLDNEGQGGQVKFNYTVTAVQGTKAAVEDYFKNDLSAADMSSLISKFFPAQ